MRLPVVALVCSFAGCTVVQPPTVHPGHIQAFATMCAHDGHTHVYAFAPAHSFHQHAIENPCSRRWELATDRWRLLPIPMCVMHAVHPDNRVVVQAEPVDGARRAVPWGNPGVSSGPWGQAALLCG